MKKLSLLLVLASISCGGGNEAMPPAASPSASPAPTAAPAASATPSGDGAVAWENMNKQQRGKFMRENVMPKMKELFAAHDGKRFAKVSCGTCHGAGAADGSFKMPNPQLPPLPATKEKFEALGKKHPETMKFMATQVRPEMAKLLGEKEMDPANPQAGGFGCMDCHTMSQ